MSCKDGAIFFGYGILERIGEIKRCYAGRKVLLVTGKGSYEACGAKSILERHFSSDQIVRFFDFEVNPKLSDAIRGCEVAKEADTDFILAVGGGSVIDMAKLIKAFLISNNDEEAIARGQKPVVDPNIPLVAVPTTAGSGSEATHFAVVYIGKEKFSLSSPHLLPDIALLDGSLLGSASSYQKAVNGLDALAQAIEGGWAVSSTEESRDYSLEAIRLLMRHLKSMVEGGFKDDLQNVMRASNLAGKSINIAKSTAPHAFSYAFTSYHDIPHGHAVWLTLPEVFAIHLGAEKNNVTDPRGADFFYSIMNNLVSTLGIGQKAESATFLRNFMKYLGLESDMRKMGLKTEEQRRYVSEQVNLQRLANNPVALSDQEIAKIFHLTSDI